MAFLEVEQKEDSPEKLLSVAGKPTKYYLKASEFMAVVSKINEVHALVSGKKFTSEVNFIFWDNVFFVPANRTWEIFAIPYTNPADVSIEVTLASAGMKRLYFFVATTNNTIEVRPGPEGVNAVAPEIVDDELVITFVIMNDSGVEEEPSVPVYGNAYIAKESVGPRAVESTGNINLEFNEHATMRLSGTIEKVVGWNFEPSDFNIYQGQDVVLVNDQPTPITFKNDDADAIKPIFTIGAADFVINQGESFQGKFFLEEAVWVLKQIGVLKSTKSTDYYNKHTVSILAANNATTVFNLGFYGNANAWTNVGTNVLVSNNFDLANNVSFLLNQSAATAGSSCGWKENSVYDASLFSGYDYLFKFSVGDVISSSARTFVGLYGTTALLPNVNPSDFTSGRLGIGNDSGDSNLSIFHKTIGGVAVKIPLGANFPAHDPTKIYEFRLVAEPVKVLADASVKWQITETTTGQTLSGTIVSDLPNGVTHTMWRNNGTTAASVGIKLALIKFTRLT